MSQGKWSRLSPTQRADIWIRWKAGQTLHEIGRVYGKCHNAIRAVLLPRGGIPPFSSRASCVLSGQRASILSVMRLACSMARQT